MDYRARIVRSISAIGPAAWVSLDGYSCYTSYEWLALLEQRLKPWTYYVIIADRQQQIVALAPCYKFDELTINHRYNVRDLLAGTHALDELKDHLPPALLLEQRERAQAIQEEIGPELFPSLVCAAMQGYASGPMLQRDLSADAREWVAQALIAAITRLSQYLGCQTTAFLYLTPDHPMAAILAERTDLGMVLEGEARLQLVGNDFEHYLGSLSSKRRAAIRREIRHFAASEITCSIHQLAELPLERLAELLRNVQAKYGEAEGELRNYVAYLEQLRQLALPHSVFVARASDDLVAFALFFYYQGSLFARLVGIDYERVHDDFCYFNILFYKPIATALHQGVHSIHYGIEALNTKVARGCDLVPLYGYISCQNKEILHLLQSSAATIAQARRQAYAAIRKQLAQRSLRHDQEYRTGAKAIG